MADNNIVSKVDKLLKPILEELELELFDLIFVKEANNWYLRVFIDKDFGVNINDCENVSRAIEKILDEKDFISQSYTLEVSSPGADRPLRNDEDFKKFEGAVIDIKLYKSIEKRKDFQGELIGLYNNEITINENGKVLKFNKDDVATCKLAVIF
jgi:ribosome maturation factor RimP